MINIAVVDDQKEFLDLIVDRIQFACGGRKDICIFPHLSGKSMLEEIDSGIRYDVVFCDIEMDEMDGIELGRRLKQKWPTLYLVYLTSYSEYAAESYIVAAFQYILKQDMAERLPGVLEELFARIEQEHRKYRIIGSAEEKRKVMYTDMILLTKEKSSKYVEFETTEGIFRERNTLDAILQDINSREFVSVERGVVVNMRHIMKIKGDVLCLSNKKEIHISRKRLQEVKRLITEYWGCL
ncbi:MAG: LytR/AlgR family response regulator transcription factor [Agathobacter sp.]